MNKDKIIIGESYDGFRLKYKDYEIYVNQEDNQAEELSKFFNKLGYEVQVEQDY